MSLANVFDIAGMGMSAQSIRLNTTASNLANAQAASSNIDEVYRARHPVFETMRMDMMANNNGSMPTLADDASMGMRVTGIVESDAPLVRRYEPNHLKADEEGYVYYPNVNVVEEMADMISASRSFQVNVELMNSAKQMMQGLLRLGQ
ncbi:flagellar basal-body rod protein FlgC [marine gamma proteobacterium HTCC2143]|jgi:flagellar basal-body rod protein FlgC|uniref:Flagellar basal-body rod protein FlgC n=1 Tax=marine gamma proteobacterium HTCC2143 TaxID=247633 RepID=A0YG84_9GAMM|nr:flagellar basal-body rod protein FlgC [marine gamma proteobacterium HTCC2143]